MITTAIRITAAACLGGMAGLLGGLFGVGGGFLVIPLLGFFYGMDQQTAQGTVLIMVVPNVVWAFSRYRRRFGIDLRMAATIAGSALIATYRTARLATGLDPHVVRLAFALFLATIAATVAYHTWRGVERVGVGPTRPGAGASESGTEQARAPTDVPIEGERRIVEVLVIGKGPALVSPCGGCRQRLREFADDATRVHICDADGLRRTVTLGELLPLSFGPGNLSE